MTDSDLTNELVNSWNEKIESLNREHDEIEESQDGYYAASWDAAFERAEPTIKRKVVQQCLEGVEDSGDINDLLEEMADWRKEADSLDKRILDKKKWFRATMTQLQLEECIKDLEGTIPEDVFEECILCGVKKLPVSDKRRKEGFRWECPECT